VKITVENQELLQRIQNQQAYYDVSKWEKDFKNNEKYLKNMCVYPSTQSLNSSRNFISARRSSAGLMNDELSKTSSLYKKMEYNLDQRKSSDGQMYQQDKMDSKKLILYKKGVRIGMNFFIVEISVDNNYFQIILDDVENPDTKIIAMRIEEGRQLISENNNNYEKIISKIYFEKGKPRITGFYEENLSQQEKIEIEKHYVEEKVIKEKDDEIILASAENNIKDIPKQNINNPQKTEE
jgi:hypothetical protein